MSNIEKENRVNLQKWRDARPALSSNYKTYFTNIIEELLEPMYVKEDVKYLTEEIVDRYYTDELAIADYEVVDAINDIRVFSENEIELMGYDSSETFSETIKEISSRKQDPIQAHNWNIDGSHGEKWLKDKSQDISTLYKAKYEKVGD